MEGQVIYTVVIKDTDIDNGLDTVSFNDINVAIDYALDSLSDLLQFEDTLTYEEAKEKLDENMFLKTREYTVWIEESRLF